MINNISYFIIVDLILGTSEKLLPLRSVCGLGADKRIFGGTKAELDEFPWMALLSYEKRMYVS